MHKQAHAVPRSLPPPNKDSKKPSMACRQGAEPTSRSSGGADGDARTHISAEGHPAPSAAAPDDDFEFCVLSSGGLAPAGDDAPDMCVADEVFSGGKLLPLRLSSADASALLLLRSDSLDGAATASASTTTTSSGSGFSSSTVSRSSSSSSCVSRSTSSNSARSDHAGSSSSSKSAPSAVPVPPRRSLSGSVFYAHPSPSPQAQRRSRTAAPAPPRRSTGSAPAAAWGVIRLGVVGAPEVYAPRPRAPEYRKAAASRGGSRSARFEPHRAAGKKLALGLLGAGLVCSCSPDAVVAPVGSAEVAAAEARRRRKKKAEEKKRSATAEQGGKDTGTAWRSRILEWLEDLSVSKEF